MTNDGNIIKDPKRINWQIIKKAYMPAGNLFRFSIDETNFLIIHLRT